MTTSTTAPSLTVNGELRTLADATPHTTALDWLRDRGLTGTKEGCAEGECGACAILVARPAARGPVGDATAGAPTEPPAATDWVALNACLVPVAALDGQEVVTVEGLGSPDRLHPVQRELAERGGSQCGYCTPGFVCALAAEFYRPGRPAGDVDDHALSGNLCRCTGYRPILEAAHALGVPAADDPWAARRRAAAPASRPTRLDADGASFVRPATLAEAIGLLADHPDAVPLAGGTDVGVDLNLRGVRPALLVAIDRLAELRELAVEEGVVRIGAALTLTEIERGLAGRVPLLDELATRFASRLIRNAATLGGNLGTASPIGDAAPALLALEASVVLAGPTGERVVDLADFFVGYRRTVRGPDELIREIRIPLPLAERAAFHKVAKRRVDDISSVAVAIAVDLDASGVVRRARLGLGGVAATPLRARSTEAALEGRRWDAATVAAAADVLAGEGTPLSDHRASAAYRRAMLGESLRSLLVRWGDAP